MSRTCRLDLLDAARPGLFDRLRACGRWFGRLVILSLALAVVLEVRSLFRELDALRAAVAASTSTPATTAAGPGLGRPRQVWLTIPGTIRPGTELRVSLVLDEVGPMVAGR